MYIKSITIENFKGFTSPQTIEFNKGINVFVGENNTGKSTVFEAIDFLWNGKKDIESLKNKKTKGEISVEMEVILGEKDENLLDKYYVDNGIIKLKRDSQGNLKYLGIKNNESEWYDSKGKNEIRGLFDLDFIWADTQPEELTKYTSSSIIGKLTSKLLGGFDDDENIQELKRVYDKAFGKNGLSAKLNDISLQAESILKEQFGDASLRIGFKELDVSSLTKNIGISIDDGVDTQMDKKGTGMQRSVALSLLQLYANANTESTNTPFFIFIDEPEVSLHPNAQIKLSKSLNNLSKNQQLFITTHSPYVLKGLGDSLKNTHLFTKPGGQINIKKSSYSNWLFGEYSPTLGEINYYAYDLPTEEFHNELYGKIQSIATEENDENEKEPAFENYLKSYNLQQTKDYIRLKGGKPQPAVKRTLQTYIRNIIHHPENHENPKFNDKELRKSIEEMIKLLQSLQTKSD